MCIESETFRVSKIREKTEWDDMAHEKKARENEPEEEQFQRQ